MGAASFEWHSNYQPDSHYSHLAMDDQPELIQLRLEKQLPPNAFNDRFYAEVVAINDAVSSGKVLVLFDTGSNVSLAAGDVVLVYADLGLPAKARNPGDFDYKEYLASIDVYGQIYVNTSDLFEVSAAGDKLSYSIRARNNLISLLSDSGLKDQPLAMIQALLLGQRDSIDPEVTRSFRDAGVIHILALSGMHVGIILLLLQNVTGWMKRFKYGAAVQTVFLISCLIAFGFLTGMSPSIRRAVTMFSFIAVGLNIKYKSSVFHSLTVSAFVLLILDPRLLFQVGFQLSYSAVLSIVLIQPVLARLWPAAQQYVEHWWQWQWFRKKGWEIFTVTVAAQLGIAPISIFYFHQFPGLFILGNMLLLPLLPFILGGAILLMIGLLLNLDFLIDLLVAILNPILEWLIAQVSYISSLEDFILKDLYLDFIELLLIYGCIIGVVIFIRPHVNRSRKERHVRSKMNWTFHLALVSGLLLVCSKIYNVTKKSPTDFYVLHQTRGTAITVANDSKAVLFTNLARQDQYWREKSMTRLQSMELLRDKEVDRKNLINLIQFQNQQLVVVDSTGIYHSSIKNTPVLLSHSPRIHLQRLIDSLQPNAIISDGSNYRSFVQRWEETCDVSGIPFYNTYEDGAVDITQLNAELP